MCAALGPNRKSFRLMKTLFALLLFSSFVCAAPMPQKVFKTPALAARPARVVSSKVPPPPQFIHARRINSAGWESTQISPLTIAILKPYPYVIIAGKVQWQTGNNSRFRFITRDPDGSWWDGVWCATFVSGLTISAPMPTNQTWFLVSP